MFVHNHLLLVLLVASAVQSDIPRYIQGQWIIAGDNPQYEDTDGLKVEEGIWPSPPEVVEVVTEHQNSLTTSEPFVMKEQEPEEEAEEESAVWKIVLVVAILLVSIVGVLSMAYYMCVWRGGRIHYKPQKEGYA